ncbi:MAG: purine-binding chemotaxis protein CheW [bacterium]|nr:purine-binding chemotaxis protein CheW [bacterium]
MTTTLLDDQKTAQISGDIATGKMNDEEGKYLTFKLANEEYGVEVLKVREIMGLIDITSVPQMPPYMKGVVNLRGKVIPVVHLRLKFGLHEIEHSEQTCIIVVDVGKEIGIIVDCVSEVLDIAGDSIEPPPSMGGSVDTSFILGMGKVGEEVKILLDIDKVLTTDEIDEVTAITSNEVPPATAG